MDSLHYFHVASSALKYVLNYFQEYIIYSAIWHYKIWDFQLLQMICILYKISKKTSK